MAARKVQRRSQGTDMYEYLRFPDAIAYDDVVRLCNRLAIPLGNRSVTNKCYCLLWKATYFPSSVFIGVETVRDLLQTELYVPCLVILAGDTFIDGMLGSIPQLCINKSIPYIFIPGKLSIAEALNVDNEVLAVFICFNRDPGMHKEFEDAFEGIRSQCFGRKRKRGQYHRGHSSSVPPEIGPRGEMPQMVSTYVSTIPPGGIISTLLQEVAPSSSSEWLTISDDDESLKDFTVNVFDRKPSESTHDEFQEYIRVPSPTPALPPSQLRHQNSVTLHTHESSSALWSGEESPLPGPSREYSVPLVFPRKRRPSSQTNFSRKRRSWPIALPYAPREDGAGEGPSDSRSSSSYGTINYTSPCHFSD